MRPLDTNPATHAVQVRLLRARSNSERLGMALQLSDDVRAIQRAGIHAHRPEYSSTEVEWALRRLIHGDELFQRAWPDAPLLKP